jgi:hypothetical protein
LALFALPFFHSHFGLADDSGLVCNERDIAMHHAHFPEERGASAGEGNRHADMDHSSRNTRSFVLLANLSTTTFRNMGICVDATPIPFHSSLMTLGRSSSAVIIAIHDPPERGFLSLRAPPILHSI